MGAQAHPMQRALIITSKRDHPPECLDGGRLELAARLGWFYCFFCSQNARIQIPIRVHVKNSSPQGQRVRLGVRVRVRVRELERKEGRKLLLEARV